MNEHRENQNHKKHAIWDKKSFSTLSAEFHEFTLWCVHESFIWLITDVWGLSFLHNFPFSPLNSAQVGHEMCQNLVTLEISGLTLCFSSTLLHVRCSQLSPHLLRSLVPLQVFTITTDFKIFFSSHFRSFQSVTKMMTTEWKKIFKH